MGSRGLWRNYLKSEGKPAVKLVICKGKIGRDRQADVNLGLT